MYSDIERRIARILDSFPRARQMAKFLYQRANYYVGMRGAPNVSLDPNCRMQAVSIDSSSVAAFFGYFDTCPWSTDGRYFLLHSLKEARASELDIVVRDSESNASRTVGTTSAWNFQQGSMAQWLPGPHVPTLVYNDVIGSELGCRLVSLDGERGEIAWPIQTIRCDGLEAVSINYKRLWRIRPEYGYAPSVQNMQSNQSLDKDGIWVVDLESGVALLAVSLQQLVDTEPRRGMTGSEHKVNHVLYAPTGQRMVFMHRWLGPQGKFSRLYCCNSDGTDLRLLLDHRMVSHYAWKDDEKLLVWARTPNDGDGYYIVDVLTGRYEVFADGSLNAFGDGHPTFSPDRRWLVTDTYPDRSRQRHLLLHDCEGGRTVRIASLFSPWEFDGPARCDLHPRWSPDGRSISIDSAHEGRRRCYVVTVEAHVSR